MSKLTGWEGRLSSVVDDAVNRKFIWGEHDCSLFAARCADAVYGTKFEAANTGKYKTARGAAGRVKRLGGYDAHLRKLGFNPVLKSFAQRGDTAIIEQDGREALGVVMGPNIVAASTDGLAFVPVGDALGVWRK
jgi:hypothetical protein